MVNFGTEMRFGERKKGGILALDLGAMETPQLRAVSTDKSDKSDKSDSDNDPARILRKEKHFQQTVFHADFKSAIKTFIGAT